MPTSSARRTDTVLSDFMSAVCSGTRPMYLSPKFFGVHAPPRPSGREIGASSTMVVAV
jgi:hypothetical protein